MAKPRLKQIIQIVFIYSKSSDTKVICYSRSGPVVLSIFIIFEFSKVLSEPVYRIGEIFEACKFCKKLETIFVFICS